LGEHGGLSMGPAALPTDVTPPPPAVTHEAGTRGALHISADAGQLARILVPAALLALVGMLVLAGVVTAVVLTAGVLLGIMVAIVGLVGLGGVGMAVAVRASRHSLPRNTSDAALIRSWQSAQPWLGPLAQSPERRLTFVAVDIVAGITHSQTWASDYLDDHRIRLDLATELDEIDEQAYQLASLRHQLGDRPPDHHADVLNQSWNTLVDRVTALRVYADRLRALESVLTHHATDDRTALADAATASLIAGSVRDELASDQVRSLADDLGAASQLPSGNPDVTNSDLR
jgi:hypothetical protein